MAAEKKIGGLTYRCEKLPASEALKLYVRVSQFFAPAPGLMATIKKDGSKEITPANAFMVLAMTEGADPERMHDFVADLVALCTVGPDACIMGVKPEGMDTAVDVAWFAMQTQFADFLAVGLKSA